ncbi:MAG: substrate-binding domain-containing protein [Syntrophales bacterium]
MDKNNFKLTVIWATALVFLALSSFALAEEIKAGAGAAPTENVFNKIKEPFEKASGVTLTLISNGPEDALKDLDKGLLHVAAGGVTFSDWMEMMEKGGYKIPNRDAYKYRVIGKDVVKVIVNKANTVKKLSREQLVHIFTGKVDNWKAVGGKDMPITVVWGSKIPGTNAVFQKQAMGGAPYTKKVQESTTAAEIKKVVASTPGAVGLAPLSLVDGAIAAPDIPEVGRPITAITKGAPSANVVKLFDFIRGEGQKYLAK